MKWPDETNINFCGSNIKDRVCDDESKDPKEIPIFS